MPNQNEKVKVVTLPEPRVGAQLRQMRKVLEIVFLQEWLRRSKEELKMDLGPDGRVRDGDYEAFVKDGKLFIRD